LEEITQGKLCLNELEKVSVDYILGLREISDSVKVALLRLREDRLKALGEQVKERDRRQVFDCDGVVPRELIVEFAEALLNGGGGRGKQ